MQRDELVRSHVEPGAMLGPIIRNAGVTLRGAAAEAPLAAQVDEAERQLDDSGRALVMAIACFTALCRVEVQVDVLLARMELLLGDSREQLQPHGDPAADPVAADPVAEVSVAEVPIADAVVEVPTTSIASAAAEKALGVVASVRPLMRDLGLYLPSLLEQDLNAEFSSELLAQIAAVPGLATAAKRVRRPSDCAPEVLGEFQGAGLRTVYLMVAWAAAVVRVRRTDCDLLASMADWCARLTKRAAHAKTQAASRVLASLGYAKLSRSNVTSLQSRMGELLFFSAEYGVSELWIHPDVNMVCSLSVCELEQQPDNLRRWWVTSGTSMLAQFDLLAAVQSKDFGILCQRQWLAWVRGVLQQRIKAAGEPATVPRQTVETGRLLPSDVPAGENPVIGVPCGTATPSAAPTNSARDANTQVVHCGHYVCFINGAVVSPQVWMIRNIYSDGNVQLERDGELHFAPATAISRVSQLTRGHKFFVDCALAHGVNGLADTVGVRVAGTVLFWADAVKYHRDSEFELL